MVYALFSHNGKTYKKILGADEGLGFDECYVPNEVNKAPGFKVTLVCGDRIPTNEVEIKLGASGYTEKIENQKATPSIIDQMNSYM